MHELYQKTLMHIIKKGPQTVAPEVVEIASYFIIATINVVLTVITPAVLSSLERA